MAISKYTLTCAGCQNERIDLTWSRFTDFTAPKLPPCPSCECRSVAAKVYFDPPIPSSAALTAATPGETGIKP